MRVLAIESSCDETAVAILSGEGVVLTLESNLVRSQIDIHQAYGGVVPEVAAREHLAYLFPMIRQALVEARINDNEIDAIAVTAGPGLAPALRVGVEAAKALAWAWHKPLVPVCHLEGHIYASWLETSNPPQFPALALIVSGGHTELVFMKSHGDFVRLGETIDDAAGEAFDKVAKMLGLPYPGGPQVEQLAKLGDPSAFNFPRALLDKPNLDFSFAGLKTSVLYKLRENEASLDNAKFRSDIAASFQEAVIHVLIKKTARAIAEHSPKSIILAGGVAANLSLRHSFQALGATHQVAVHVPPFAYAVDNAGMIAAAGYYRALANNFVDPLVLSANPNLDIV
jgi:N6-L-threonylcarbamoyladenine synthase